MKLSTIETIAKPSNGSQISPYTSIWLGRAEPVSDARIASRNRSPYASTIFATNGAATMAATIDTRIASIT